MPDERQDADEGVDDAMANDEIRNLWPRRYVSPVFPLLYLRRLVPLKDLIVRKVLGERREERDDMGHVVLGAEIAGCSHEVPMPTCDTCGREVGSCGHTERELQFEIDLDVEQRTELMSVSALKESSSIGELFDPTARSISVEEAVAEATVRVTNKLSTMTGAQVIEVAVRQMLRETLGHLRQEGASFSAFEFDVEVPLRRASFSVRVRKV